MAGFVSPEWLQSFEMVSRSESYDEAANRLSRTQPTVWKQVNSLTNNLDLQVFEPGTTTLSQQGREILPFAQKVLQAYDDFLKEAERLRNGVVGEVRVACYPAQVNFFLAEVAGEFKRKYPDARVSLSEFSQAGTKGLEHLDRLERGEVDLAVAPKRKGLGGIKIYESTIVTVLPQNHSRRGAELLGPEELQGERLLVAPRGYHSRTEIDRAFDRAGLKPQIETESSSWMALLALGEHEVGIPIVPDDALPGRAEPPYPAFRSAEDRPLVREWWLQWRGNDAPAGAVNRFVRFVEKFLQAHRD